MLLKFGPLDGGQAPLARPSDIIRDHRARIALEKEAREQQRQQEQAEQCSSSNPPATRIQIWEKVHGLRLPLNAAHPILDLVATRTRLTLAEVREEQRARLAARSGLVAQHL